MNKKLIVFAAIMLLLNRRQAAAQTYPCVKEVMDGYNATIDTVEKLRSLNISRYSIARFDTAMHRVDSAFTIYRVDRTSIECLTVGFGTGTAPTYRNAILFIFDQSGMLEEAHYSFRQFDEKGKVRNWAKAKGDFLRISDSVYRIQVSGSRLWDGQRIDEVGIQDTLVRYPVANKNSFHQSWNLLNGTVAWQIDSSLKARSPTVRTYFDSAGRVAFRINVRHTDCIPVKVEEFQYVADTVIQSDFILHIDGKDTHLRQKLFSYKNGGCTQVFYKGRMTYQYCFKLNALGLLVEEEKNIDYGTTARHAKHYYFK